MVHVTIWNLTSWNFTKSDEFHGNSVRILCWFCKASVQLTVELQYYFRGVSPISAEWYFAVRGMILRCLWICPYKVNVFVFRWTSLPYTNMTHKLHTGSYVRTLHSCHTYVTLLYTLHVLPLKIHSYVQYHCDDSTLSTTTSWLPFDYSKNTVQFRGCLWRLWLCWCPSTNPQTPFDGSTDNLWRLCRYPRRCRGKTADYRHSESANFVKSLVTLPYVCVNAYFTIAVFSESMSLASITLDTFASF